ncbi:thiopurine S-methyltransferase [Thalassotalea insulae]|uniref:Thiopurine S-methyltransferase n=1 Tax=Thalassotalea insulae TaxID=2056778 RepID=A0ABQ6GNZ2_9GAMM|nr:thiopurine S-methyltransferase [Thalassotalea insulae]GLX77062.1 thiopurine S-methyltransferase [Thalassotalea insulae]
MKASFWHACWERNSLGFHQTAFHPFLAQYLLPRITAEHQSVFVPLCGKSDDMVWLAEYMEVVGSELSDIACRDFFAEKQLPVTLTEHGGFKCYQHQNVSLWQGDFFQLEAKSFRPFDWIYDRAALIALPQEMQQVYVEHLTSFMGPETTLFLISVEFPQQEMSGPPFAVGADEINSLFADFEVECLTRHPLPDKVFAQRVFDVSYLTETLYIIRQKAR